MSDDKPQERNIEYLPLAELITRLHPQNAKNHDIGKIIGLYREHGYVEHGTIDDRTGLFLAGHGRTIALDMMKKQGMQPPRGIRNGGDDWLIPVNVGYSSESDIHALAYLAASNQATIDGGWNEPALAELLQEVHNSADIALESTGFDAEGLDEILRDLGNNIIWEYGEAKNIQRDIMDKIHGNSSELIRVEIGAVMTMIDIEVYNQLFELCQTNDMKKIIEQVLARGMDNVKNSNS